jgi:hypothetical protein
MRKAVIGLVVIACCGCRAPGTATPATEVAHKFPSELVDRVWARTDSTGLPGVMRIFLKDGTLVMDSCWETYQLATWQAESDSVVVWQEGGAGLRASILQLGPDTLVLRVALANGSQDEHYRPATVPWICPDMRR